MQSSLYREPYEKGLEKGRIDGQTELLWSMINRKFPGVSSYYYAQLKELDFLRLKSLGEELLNIQSLTELDRYLKSDKTQVR